MTEPNAPEAGGEVQNADSNFIDSLFKEGANETAENQQEEVVNPEKPEEQPEKEETEVWSKKTRNAFRREKQEKTKLRAELQEARVKLAALEAKNPAQPAQQQQKPASDGPPKEADFNNYADYLEARNDWKIEQRLKEHATKQQESFNENQEQAWTQTRTQAVATQAHELAKTAPDLIALLEEYSDTADSWSPQLQKLFLEADNGALAFYNLAKEGKIESLTSMSLSRAAMEIGRAQTQAAIKPQSKAPAPLPASRGSVASQKSLDQMSADEIDKWLKS